MTKDIREAEIISQPEGFYYKEQYYASAEQTKKISMFAWMVSIASLFLSFIPIFGFIFAIFALIVAIVKKVPVFIPIVSLVISSIISMIVLFFAWIISLIF